MIRVPFDPEEYGYVREDQVPNAARLYEFMEGVLEALYETGDLDELEHCLEEACAEVNLSLPGKMLKVKSKGADLQFYLGYQRGVLDSMQGKAL